MKVLFAEDEPDLQEVVTAYLELQGYHVTAVGNGAEAVEKARSDGQDRSPGRRRRRLSDQALCHGGAQRPAAGPVPPPEGIQAQCPFLRNY